MTSDAGASNDSSEYDSSSDVTSLEFAIFRNCVDFFIIVCTLFGNILIISSIWRVKKLRQVFSSVLVMNLAFCDVLLVLFSIPADMVESHTVSYPFSRFGCKLISPVATYYVNCIAITLTLISVERYLIIRYNLKFGSGMRRKVIVVIIIHLVALSIVIPYIMNQDIRLDDNGEMSCEEIWENETSKMYTIILFLVQFAIPLPVLFILYTLSWRTIQKRNLKTIRVLGSTKKRKIPACSSCCGKVETPNCRHRKRLNSKLSITSEVSIARQKQTKYYLKMFTFVVILFTVCMMPNQITWFYLAFKPRPLNKYVEMSFYWLTYANGVLNPWIYAGFNPYFKRAYRNFVKRFLSVCFKEEIRTLQGKRLETMIFHQNNSLPTTPKPPHERKTDMTTSGENYLWNTPWSIADNHNTSLSTIADKPVSNRKDYMTSSGENFLWNTPWSIADNQLNSSLLTISDSSLNAFFDEPEVKPEKSRNSYSISAAILSPYAMVFDDHPQTERNSKLYDQTLNNSPVTTTKTTTCGREIIEEGVEESPLSNTPPLMSFSDDTLTENLKQLSFKDFDQLSETHC